MSKLQRLVDEIKQLTVIELAELVGQLETELGVSAAAMSVPASGASSAPAEEVKTTFKVELIGYGDNDKMKVIKTLRSLKSSLGLIEAKTAVEGSTDTPYVVEVDLAKEKAEEIKKAFEEVGGKVRIS